MKYIFLVLIVLIAIVVFGTWSFRNSFLHDVKSSMADNSLEKPDILTEEDILYLPEVVKKYIRNSGSLGKPKVQNFSLEFSGRIRQNEQSEWMPFTTIQYNFIKETKRYFFMKARMKNLPVAGYHCYKDGRAFMDIRLFSFFKVQYQSGNEMDISETVTFFNDMCCMAPASLIDPGITWEEAEGNTVNASFTKGDIRISAQLIFNERGELINFVSNDRYAAMEDNSMQNFPWSTPLSNYKDFDGYKLAGEAKMVYAYPEGDFCYGNFQLKKVQYNCKKLR